MSTVLPSSQLKPKNLSTDFAILPIKNKPKKLSVDVAIFPIKNKKICLQMLPSSQLKTTKSVYRCCRLQYVANSPVELTADGAWRCPP